MTNVIDNCCHAGFNVPQLLILSGRGGSNGMKTICKPKINSLGINLLSISPPQKLFKYYVVGVTASAVLIREPPSNQGWHKRRRLNKLRF